MVMVDSKMYAYSNVANKVLNNTLGDHHLKYDPTRPSHFGQLIEYPNIIPSECWSKSPNELILQGKPCVGAKGSNLLMLLI